jgi:hypothetical protein
MSADLTTQVKSGTNLSFLESLNLAPGQSFKDLKRRAMALSRKELHSATKFIAQLPEPYQTEINVLAFRLHQGRAFGPGIYNSNTRCEEFWPDYSHLLNALAFSVSQVQIREGEAAEARIKEEEQKRERSEAAYALRRML